MITSESMKFYWEYFRLLCKKFDNTREYIDHSLNENGQLKYGKVCSWEFQQILILTAVEFENMTKQLCKLIDNENFDEEKANIKDITKIILSKYPKIVKTRIYTYYNTIYPLSNWKLAINAQSDTYVAGLKWWKSYTDLKHRTFEEFNNASLENCINALASLMVIELYLMKEINHSTLLSFDRKCEYFSETYSGCSLYTGESEQLPDFAENDANINKDE